MKRKSLVSVADFDIFANTFLTTTKILGKKIRSHKQNKKSY